MANDNLVLAINLINAALSQYTNFTFNSFCVLPDETVLGANDSGIFEMEQLTGVETVGDTLDAYFQTHPGDFGALHRKRARRLVISGEANGNLEVKLIVDEGTAKTLETLTLNSVANKQTTGQVRTGSKTEGVHWAVRIGNLSSADFSIDAIQALIKILGFKA